LITSAEMSRVAGFKRRAPFLAVNSGRLPSAVVVGVRRKE
jgi:hypothetical protein